MSYYFCKVQNYGHESRITIYCSIVSCKRIGPITAKKLITHKSSLKYNIPTWGVMAHGLDNIYPKSNFNLAKKMLDNGGLITEFLSDTRPARENFIKRNRIIAGLSDATVVVESASKGGALVTADIADSYHREVFALPGRLGDPKSEGCLN